MRRVILVDDDEEEFELFSSALMEITSDVELYHSDGCSDVLRIISDWKPELVFLDINMPTLDGIDCLKTIRSMKSYEELPVVMYSTSNNQISIQDAYQNGAHLYVVKSYSYEGLLNVLRKVLSINWKTYKRGELPDFVLSAELPEPPPTPSGRGEERT